ncbi:tRNA 5-methoxyuridine(34)/uridine 5-oxyacetic acid(34) synthase CmoB [Hahella sp. CCB-MM4]|uniref:tRNA 5-methoxyuridine(34)/uridine 5-oxyacetic acid(34) synthase CmoB n=1 Tax=Hahella sp. (strain CCB-MM4) TaxID=1926491 RepID=UPI000B9A3C58|nr:tRNA 5-methoxyuridine(34)/uridine 5-oxyacetic acid(34) synthase CmoB [Hahella sp. CCB-MM4]OZG73825.1 tRNA 5-methoxyuridine(34)/uridine 5-oxyacetic acid(34) synthase CmoB [Hahella sp. CCB-MM4]
MNFFDPFFDHISHNRLDKYEDAFRQSLDIRFHQRDHGDMPAWEKAFSQLPDVTPSRLDNTSDTLMIGSDSDLTPEQRETMVAGLRGLHPWRKGPFNFFGEFIDTEWRSDWKWQRLAPHISPLKGRFVLDVGCGSGYHCWRMLGDDASFVLGIDPSPKFLFQFHAVKKYQPTAPVFYLPLRSEDLPQNMQAFDTVFSMGVLYHRRSTFDHIDELKATLKPGGELILETLVIPGDENTVLTPSDRYAQMRNVWSIGSAEATKRWIERCGFVNVRIVDETVTSLEEQRQTDWMTFQSLKDFLAPSDITRTVEGYPAPCRAIIIANKPS